MRFEISNLRLMRFRAGFLALLIAVLASSIGAQTTRRKPKPLATPPPVLTGAEIISQAGSDAEPAPTPEEIPAKPATTNAERIKQLNDRVKKLEKGQSYEDRQKRVLMNLDILKRSEERADSLREQLFKMIEKDNSITARIEQIDFDIRPEIIERSLQLSGSMKPEEIRESRRKSLAAEKSNLQSLLTQVQATRTGLNASLQRAEEMVEKLRAKAERDIDESLQQKEEEPEPEK